MDQLSDLNALCHLARLERPATGSEADELRDQLAGIVAFFQTVQAVDTDGVEPLFQPFATCPESWVRPDVPADSLTAEDALANAPEQAGGCFLVPRVL